MSGAFIMKDGFRLLFVCTGNICRSPMAEGLMKVLLPPAPGRHITVCSAGTQAVDGLPAETGAVRAVREHGADIAGHRSRAIDGSLIASANLILVMERQQARLIQGTAPVAPDALRANIHCLDMGFKPADRGPAFTDFGYAVFNDRGICRRTAHINDDRIV